MQEKANDTQIITLVHGFIEYSSAISPDKCALIHGENRYTYLYLNSLSERLAYFFSEQGVTQGDRVLFLFENGLEYIVTYYAILKCGAVAVPLGADIKHNGLASIIQETAPKAIVFSHHHEKTLRAYYEVNGYEAIYIVKNPQSSWPAKVIFSWEEVITNNGSRQTVGQAISPHALASIVYTSGSTGKPKGVMLTHANIVTNTYSICRSLRISHNDIQMIVLPLSYVMGKSLLNTHFAVGATVVINNKFAFPADVLNQMIGENVTSFSGVPSTYAYLLHRSPLKKYRDRLNSLRYCSQAGGHMPRKIKEDLLAVLPAHTELIIMYGATEAAARLTFLPFKKLPNKIDSIGIPVDEVTIKILNPHGLEINAGEIGELVASGPNIMQGYWQDRELTAKVLDKNGYHTGDLGFQDAEGYLYVVSRKDSLLKVGGHRINPQEIEDFIVSTGLVMEAAVIGLADDLLGNKLVAIVAAANETIRQEQILLALSIKIPKYKMPSEIGIVRTVPKNANGKIDREKCREIAGKIWH